MVTRNVTAVMTHAVTVPRAYVAIPAQAAATTDVTNANGALGLDRQVEQLELGRSARHTSTDAAIKSRRVVVHRQNTDAELGLRLLDLPQPVTSNP
jgi:hypothetical protein